MHLLGERKNSSAQSSSVGSSITRAFTTTSKIRHRVDDTHNASASARMGRAGSQRIRASQISLPVALVSTTNMLSYDAPDIPSAPNSRSNSHSSHSAMSPTYRKASSVSSSTDDDNYSRGDRSSVRSRSSEQTDGTSLSVEGFNPDSPEQNHLSCYFKPTPRTSSFSRTDSLVSRDSSPISSPQLPSRAPTHSLKAHALSHKRSVSRGMMSPSRESTEMYSSASASPRSAHPFGRELEQLNEAAEEFCSAVRDVEQDADLGVLKTKGLGSFCAAEYMQEIAPLFTRAYGQDIGASVPTWI